MKATLKEGILEVGLL